MNNLAMAYRDAGQLDKALTLLEHSFGLSRKTHGAEHPDTLVMLSNLAQTYLIADQPKPAIPLFKSWLEFQAKQLGNDNPQYSGLQAIVANEFLKAKQWSEAEALLRPCLATREQQQPDVWTTFNTQSMLGEALLGQENYADAEPLLLAGYEGMKQRAATIPPQGKIRSVEALDRLVRLYEAWGKPDEAAKWRQELETARAK